MVQQNNMFRLKLLNTKICGCFCSSNDSLKINTKSTVWRIYFIILFYWSRAFQWYHDMLTIISIWRQADVYKPNVMLTWLSRHDEIIISTHWCHSDVRLNLSPADLSFRIYFNCYSVYLDYYWGSVADYKIQWELIMSHKCSNFTHNMFYQLQSRYSDE